MVTVTMIDETGIGNKTLEKTFSFQNEQLSLRELLRERVFREVGNYNARQPSAFQGLVQPNETEKTLNGFKFKRPRILDAEKQFEKAIRAFDERSFIVLVNDIQVDDLDTRLELNSVKELTFLKLIPLIGG